VTDLILRLGRIFLTVLMTCELLESMSDPEEEKHTVGDIVGSFKILDLASDIRGFEQWLQGEHGISLNDNLHEGYEFFVETGMRSLLNRVIYSSFPLIPGDFVFFRARFEGVELANIPNTCQKTLFM